MRNHNKVLAKVKVYSIHCSCLVHRASHPTTENSHIGQVQFALGKYMLAVPSQLVHHVPGGGFSKDFLHNTSGHRGEASWPIVILAFSEDERNNHLFFRHNALCFDLECFLSHSSEECEDRFLPLHCALPPFVNCCLKQSSASFPPHLCISFFLSVFSIVCHLYVFTSA